MAAGSEGRVVTMLRVNIRLPGEQGANRSSPRTEAGQMRYFFTRKLMLLKESHG